jgi:GntR family transcriptional repressor for pyruvate dehydrogenase complex
MEIRTLVNIKFRALKTKRLSETVEESIKDSILSGKIAVGHKLPTEPEMSKQFGVSMVTIREALRGLETLGIVQKKRGKGGGTFVAQTGKDVVKDVLQNYFSLDEYSTEEIGVARCAIEPKCAAIAARNIRADEIKSLENIVKLCENKINKKKDDFSNRDFYYIQEQNVELHKSIGRATHNSFLIFTIDNLMDCLIRVEKPDVTDLQFAIGQNRDHRVIINDLIKGDADSAKKHMNDHLIDKYIKVKERYVKHNGKIYSEVF